MKLDGLSFQVYQIAHYSETFYSKFKIQNAVYLNSFVLAVKNLNTATGKRGETLRMFLSGSKYICLLLTAFYRQLVFFISFLLVPLQIRLSRLSTSKTRFTIKTLQMILQQFCSTLCMQYILLKYCNII